jgi:uncharacterized protein YjiS (DUF1127 family)
MSTLYHRRMARRVEPANDNRHPSRASLLDAGAPWPIRLGLLVAEWLRRHRSRQSLAGLSAYELRDIGLTPADQHRECAKPFWRE